MEQQQLHFTIRQTGRNPKFPEKAVFWEVSEKNIPSWISDNLMIEAIYLDSDQIEQKKLKCQKSNTGDRIFYSVVGNKPISVPGDPGILIWDGKQFYGLSQKQFNLLYEKV